MDNQGGRRLLPLFPGIQVPCIQKPFQQEGIMADPFMSQISMVGFDYPPRGWAKCDGALLQINQYQALFSLLGTAFGGDGRSTVGLPDMRGRSPVHVSSSYRLGWHGGSEQVSIGGDQTPPHRHTMVASSNPAGGRNTTGALLGAATSSVYATPPSSSQLVPLDGDSLTAVGHEQGHENRQPYTTINFIISLTGIYPSRS